MNTDGTDDKSFVGDISQHQAILASQLSPAISTMHHFDELLQWLSYAVVRHFNVQLVQCWTNQISQAGRLSAQLRTLVRQDTSFPEQLAVNEPMTLIAQQVISERRSYKILPVETLFPQYQTSVLKRYGLHYCGACFISRSALLPQAESTLYQERSPALLAMCTLLFLRQFTQMDLVSVVGSLFDQATAIAEHRGLLTAYPAFTPPPAYPYQSQPTPLPPSYPYQSQPTPQPPAYPYQSQPTPLPSSYPYRPQPTPLPPSYAPQQPFAPQQPTPLPPSYAPQQPSAAPQSPQSSQQEAIPAVDQLIPRRKRDANLMVADNPFANKSTISDKHARRLHLAIDGRANIAALSASTGMTMKEVYEALQKLLKQNRIELYEPDGRPARYPLLPDNA